MTKIWTLALILTISTLFIHVPDKGEIGFILNPKVTLSYNQYFWFICQHLIMVSFALIIYDESEDHKTVLGVFVWLQIADMVGFVLSYDDPLKDYILNFNILKLTIFILAVAVELWKHSKP